jgi:hypothetical protein
VTLATSEAFTLDLSFILPYFSHEDATFSDSPQDLIFQCGDMVSALLYSTIFFPEFIEVDGSILLKENVPDVENKFRSRRVDSTLSLAESEASYNSIEVAYAFSTRPIADYDTDTSPLEQNLAEIIAYSWRLRLKDLYPSRVFSVSVLTAEESGSVISVEFFEIR